MVRLCSSSTSRTVANLIAAFAIVTDLVCAGFPIIILRRLKISRRTKYALWVIMGIGVLYVNDLQTTRLAGR